MKQSREGRCVSAELPKRLQAWFAEHEERLQSCGITGDVQRSPEDGRTKTSTWMTLETDDCVAVLIVWSSGEAELEYGDVATGQVRRQHRDLCTSQDLLDAIETIRAWTRTEGGRLPDW
ncbi:hypothetical protein CUT44_04670 [Streptomyces carminius]|uniref:Uncharacterized protein n=1 Tax=Streptomyces carminius TaxID=2665496 RepID=A0A2M8M5E6_9ACTN|nr:hypothetical protein [Streptomyces carminius]PJE99442.1 hypothetical protein CUT44_04670 [Streptomyces carminius]